MDNSENETLSIQEDEAETKHRPRFFRRERWLRLDCAAGLLAGAVAAIGSAIRSVNDPAARRTRVRLNHRQMEGAIDC